MPTVLIVLSILGLGVGIVFWAIRPASPASRAAATEETAAPVQVIETETAPDPFAHAPAADAETRP